MCNSMGSRVIKDQFHENFQSSRNKKSQTNPITRGRVNPDILESDDGAKSCPVSYRTINQYGGTRCRYSCSMADVLDTFYWRGALGTRMNPDTIGCVLTGEFDLNTLACRRKDFWIRKEKVADLKRYSSTCGRGLILVSASVNFKYYKYRL